MQSEWHAHNAKAQSQPEQCTFGQLQSLRCQGVVSLGSLEGKKPEVGRGRTLKYLLCESLRGYYELSAPAIFKLWCVTNYLGLFEIQEPAQWACGGALHMFYKLPPSRSSLSQGSKASQQDLGLNSPWSELMDQTLRFYKIPRHSSHLTVREVLT